MSCFEFRNSCWFLGGSHQPAQTVENIRALQVQMQYQHKRAICNANSKSPGFVISRQRKPALGAAVRREACSRMNCRGSENLGTLLMCRRVSACPWKGLQATGLLVNPPVSACRSVIFSLFWNTFPLENWLKAEQIHVQGQFLGAQICLADLEWPCTCMNCLHAFGDRMCAQAEEGEAVPHLCTVCLSAFYCHVQLIRTATTKRMRVQGATTGH